MKQNQERAHIANVQATRTAANASIGQPVFTAGDMRAQYVAPLVFQPSSAGASALAQILNPAAPGLVQFPWPAPQGAVILKGKLPPLPFLASCVTLYFRRCD